MGKHVYLDARVFVSGGDLSGWTNQIEVGEQFEEKVTTNFRSGGANTRLGGLADVNISAAGQFEEGDPTKPGDVFWAGRRLVEPWTVAPDGQSDLAAGTLVYLTQALRTSMDLLGSMGDVSPWSAEAAGSQALVRGKALHPSGVPRTATGTGAVVDLGVGPAAGQFVLANLHVIGVAAGGGSITVAIQSASTVGFASPTTRGTFTAATAVGGQSMKIAAPGTDRYWRVSYTVAGGTSPSFLFLASLGIE